MVPKLMENGVDLDGGCAELWHNSLSSFRDKPDHPGYAATAFDGQRAQEVSVNT